MTHPRTHLGFALGAELFAIDLAAVREVRALGPITRLPEAPETIRGLMGLAGAVIPVVDLAPCFGLPPITLSAFTTLVIVQLDGRLAALAADRVVDAVRLASPATRPGGPGGRPARAVRHPDEPERMLILVGPEVIARAAGLADTPERGWGA